MRKLALVNYKDEEIGKCEKLEAHKNALLHRAFSVMLKNSKGEFLLQRRAEGKYHSGGLLANSCCSHPEPGRGVVECAKERLVEELGICVNELTDIGSFVYYHKFEDGLVEYELDHVLFGNYDGDINFNKEEVSGVFWKTRGEIHEELLNSPEKYSVWFKEVFYMIENKI